MIAQLAPQICFCLVLNISTMFTWDVVPNVVCTARSFSRVSFPMLGYYSSMHSHTWNLSGWAPSVAGSTAPFTSIISNPKTTMCASFRRVPSRHQAKLKLCFSRDSKAVNILQTLTYTQEAATIWATIFAFSFFHQRDSCMNTCTAAACKHCFSSHRNNANTAYKYAGRW